MASNARLRSGVPPKANSTRRRADAGEWKVLPKVCERPVPEWPDFARAEGCALEKWAEVWRKPQAEMWHELGMVDIVAIYVKTLVDVGEDSMPTPQRLASLRQQADTLLLTPAAMRGCRYVIDGDEDHLKLKNVLALVERAKTGDDDEQVITRRFKTAQPVADDAE